MEKIFDLQLFATPVQPVPGTNTLDYTTAELADNTGFGKLLEPGLRKIFFDTYDEVPEQYSKLFNVMTSTKARETDFGLGAFGDWSKRASHVDEVDYKTISPGLERTYIHDSYSDGFMVTREMYDDEQYRQIEKMAKNLARAGRYSVEKSTATLLINAFTSNGYDGVPLISATHPLVDSSKKGDNLVTGALNDANLKKAIQKMREQLDEAGNLIQLKPTHLVVPPALEDTAVRLLNSVQVTGGELNDTNKFLSQSGIQVLVMDFIGAAAGGSDTAWFLVDMNNHELNFFWRAKPEFKWAEDFDTFVAKYRGYMRFSFGYSDYRGIVGSAGATA